jgi:hypothetical protein
MSASRTADREALGELIDGTAWIDTHEHLVEESSRLGPEGDHLLLDMDGEAFIPADFSSLLLLYVQDDLVSAGLGEDGRKILFSATASSDEKWTAIEPFFEACRHTGYWRAADLSAQALFGVPLRRETLAEIDAGLRELRRAGFYRHVIQEVAGIERCQVHALDGEPFRASADPDLLQQDLSIAPLACGIGSNAEERCGFEVATLDDYLEMVEWCFATYAAKAVAVKCYWAYWRPLAVAAPVEPPRQEFERLRAGSAEPGERRLVEDFLFQRCVDLATANGLPVKLHLGHLAGHFEPAFQNVFNHVGDLVPFLQANQRTKFVLMHIAWPQAEQLLAVAKHHPNVTVDLCWAWILAPRSCREFVMRFLTTVAANKLLCFGGDYFTVECLPGHAAIARQGLGAALAGLIDEEWLTRAAAEGLVPRLMRGNAEELFPLPGE